MESGSQEVVEVNQQLSLFKDNPTPPQIRFIRKNGRIIPIVNKKKVYKSSDLVKDRLEDMKMEVKNAEASGKSHAALDDGSYRHFGGYSTFPEFYKSMKFRNKNDFYKVAAATSGKRSDDLVTQAIEDLKSGYESSFGRVPPNLQFRVMTKQTYDNNGVVFRKLNGKVVPLRFSKKSNNVEYDDEIPF